MNKTVSKGKFITSIVLMAVSGLIFLLCCFPNFLGIGYFFQGLFGIMVFPLMILLFLVGLALLTNMKYTFSGKYTAFLIIAVLSMVCLLHTIFTSQTLNSYTALSSMQDYLATLMHLDHGISVGGAIIGALVFPIKTIVGTVGAYVFYVIIATIFSGLVIDFIIYQNTRKKRNFSNKKVQNWSKNVGSSDFDTRASKTFNNEEAYSLEQRLTKNGNDYSLDDNTNSSYSTESYDDNNTYSGSLFDTNNPVKNQNVDMARQTLFSQDLNNDNNENNNAEETNGEPKSAHEILFGNRDTVPDIFKKAEDDEPVNANRRESTSELNDDGSITTSFGRYRPTSSLKNDEEEKSPFTGFLSGSDENSDEEEKRANRRRGGLSNLDNAPLIFDEEKAEEQTKTDDEFAPLIRRRDRSVKADEKPEQLNFKNLPTKYVPPSTKLLKEFKEVKGDYTAEYKEKSRILEEILDTFKIPAKVINVVRGPKVTRYEMAMPTGISVTRVLQFEKDISMALKARHGVRIEAPIPGKNAFGIELENDICSTVGLKELIESPEFQNAKGPLPVPIGKNITGDIIVKSLAKLVHMLVAGSTGSGKSVFLHSVIMSLMYKSSPDDLRFVMIDPKRVEFSRYNRMPHMMLPEIVSDCEKANNVLTWSVKEMERRYDIMVESGCQNIEAYNKREEITSGKEKKLPYLVIIVDELAELMTSRMKKDVELKIQRITQLGRAAGIHMVVATQRPSVDVITGTIKNNMPTRVAFSLSSFIDSKTVIDEGGAEKLLGQGDMLFSAQDSNQKIRLQAAYVTDEEIAQTLKFIKEKNISTYDEEIQKEINALNKSEQNEEDNKSLEEKQAEFEERMDEYMPQALRLVMQAGKASTSMLQRRFQIGYARAARIIDQMERRGFIAEGMGNKQREVFITEEQYRELFGDTND